MSVCESVLDPILDVCHTGTLGRGLALWRVLVLLSRPMLGKGGPAALLDEEPTLLRGLKMGFRKEVSTDILPVSSDVPLARTPTTPLFVPTGVSRAMLACREGVV